MKLASLVLATSLLGCATTGGRVSAGVAGITGTALVLNSFRVLGCEDEDKPCQDRIRNEGLVLAGVTAAAVIAAIIFEIKGRPTVTTVGD
jgi:hypothetical protein